MMVLCNAIVIIEYDRRTSGLPNASVLMEHDNNRNHRRIYGHSSKHITYNIQHTTYNITPTYSHIHVRSSSWLLSRVTSPSVFCIEAPSPVTSPPSVRFCTGLHRIWRARAAYCRDVRYRYRYLWVRKISVYQYGACMLC